MEPGVDVQSGGWKRSVKHKLRPKVERIAQRSFIVFTTLVTAASILSASPMAGASQIEPAGAGLEVAYGLADVNDLLEEPLGVPLPLPLKPHQALADAVSRFASFLNVPITDPVPAIQAARLSDAFAGRTALMLSALQQCALASAQTQKAMGLKAIADALAGRQPLDPTLGTDIRACAKPALQTLEQLEQALQLQAMPATTQPVGECGNSSSDDLDLWPVLRIDTNGEDSCYRHDYVALIDTGGNDTYDNNAGSNMIDLRRRPGGDEEPADDDIGAASKARGCRHAISGLAAGDCTPVAAILLDSQGNDKYGVKESPKEDLRLTALGAQIFNPPDGSKFTDRPGDAHCTKKHKSVVARLMIQGAGFLGLGALYDGAGNDTYTGKTGAQGTGHVFGVGVLTDRGGNDVYTAIRNSQGFGLAGGIGILRDEGDGGRELNDSYGSYMPPPHDASPSGKDLDEQVVFQEDFTLNPNRDIGGVIDDAGACDRIARFMQGAGNVLSLGVLLDESGNDKYAGGFEDNTGVPLRGAVSELTGSQGYGNNAAVGMLFDAGGDDEYFARSFDGVSPPKDVEAPNRSNDRVQVDCAVGVGLFVDDSAPNGVGHAC